MQTVSAIISVFSAHVGWDHLHFMPWHMGEGLLAYPTIIDLGLMAMAGFAVYGIARLVFRKTHRPYKAQKRQK